MADQTQSGLATRCLHFLRRRSAEFWICWTLGVLFFVAGLLTEDPQNPDPSVSDLVATSLLIGAFFGGTPAAIVWAVRRSARALRERRGTHVPQGAWPPAVAAQPPPPNYRALAEPAAPHGMQYFGTRDLHHWIRDAAITRWNVGHYGDAVTVAAQLLSSRTQQKVLRFDLSERHLMREVFGADEPKPGTVRLRFFNEPDEPTRRSRLESARGLADACYGIRNVAAHHADLGWPPIQAFGYLMMFSVLASWIEEAHVYRKG